MTNTGYSYMTNDILCLVQVKDSNLAYVIARGLTDQYWGSIITFSVEREIDPDMDMVYYNVRVYPEPSQETTTEMVYYSRGIIYGYKAGKGG